VEIHKRVLSEILTFAVETGFAVNGLICSPLLGPKGNHEFLAWLAYPAGHPAGDLGALIQAAIEEMAVLEDHSQDVRPG
jgi:23S rRNA (cytidine1920-2'-O)/16S rRNA (cytidine1409-2'-O)-methyltransferase